MFPLPLQLFRTSLENSMDQQRKYAILVSASIFAVRPLADWNGAANTPRSVSAIDEAIRKAEKLLSEIERRSEK
jgi:hypothetical protein